jgi:RNA polymerase-interacting CarD/CdnL/TRCF family regulator
MLKDELSNNIRSLISPEEANSLLDQIKRWKGKPKAQWKARADAHQSALESGDPLECAKVLKGLYKLESEGDLRPRDRAHLKQSLELLTDELARALKKRPAQAERLLMEATGA